MTTTLNTNGLVSENFRELNAEEMANVQGGDRSHEVVTLPPPVLHAQMY